MIKIKIITIGHMPINFNKKRIEKWKSKVFEIDGEIENFSLPCDSDGDDWEFTDKILKTIIPATRSGDFTIAITNVPLENNYYSRRVDDNLSIMTFFEMKEILEEKNIPLENLLLRIMYAYCLVYRRFGNRIPKTIETRSFTHDETRGCVFDMTGIKSEVVYSCHRPQLCSNCIENLKKERVSINEINKIQKELKRVKKEAFYVIYDFIKVHPIYSIGISSITAIILGAIGSILASILYEALKIKELLGL